MKYVIWIIAPILLVVGFLTYQDHLELVKIRNNYNQVLNPAPKDTPKQSTQTNTKSIPKEEEYRTVEKPEKFPQEILKKENFTNYNSSLYLLNPNTKEKYLIKDGAQYITRDNDTKDLIYAYVDPLVKSNKNIEVFNYETQQSKLIYVAPNWSFRTAYFSPKRDYIILGLGSNNLGGAFIVRLSDSKMIYDGIAWNDNLFWVDDYHFIYADMPAKYRSQSGYILITNITKLDIRTGTPDVLLAATDTITYFPTKLKDGYIYYTQFSVENKDLWQTSSASTATTKYGKFNLTNRSNVEISQEEAAEL